MIVTFDGAQSLDVTGPLEVFAHAAREVDGPAYRLVVASRRGSSVTTSSGLQLATTPLSRIARADTILVAGGNEAGIRDAVQDLSLLRWLRRRAPGVRRMGSVCSGAFVLAAAGLLDGRTAATHWSAVSRLASFRPALHVDGNAIFVRDGRVWTSAGITTGIDMALAMVEEDAGKRLADRVAAQLVLHARRPGFQSQFSDLLAAQARRDDPLSAVLAWANEHLTALHVEALARHAAVSVRTLHRLCAATQGITPAKLIERLRADRARVLLGTTRLTLKEVAGRCGFRDGAQLTRSFTRCFGLSPRGYRLVNGRPRAYAAGSHTVASAPPPSRLRSSRRPPIRRR